MKKTKLFILALLGFYLIISPVITYADTTQVNLLQNDPLVLFSLANARVSLSKSGRNLVATSSISTSSSVKYRYILQKKSGSTWSNTNYSKYYTSKGYRHTFTPSSKGTYRIKLLYTIGSRSDSVFSSSLTY